MMGKILSRPRNRQGNPNQQVKPAFCSRYSTETMKAMLLTSVMSSRPPPLLRVKEINAAPFDASLHLRSIMWKYILSTDT